MKKLGQISLPQDHPQDYHRRLSVMLYQYLRDMTQQINALIDASSGGGSGSTVVSGLATVTVPINSYFHEESVTLTGCTASMRVVCSLAPHDDADVNSEKLLSVVALSAAPGTDSATINIAFSEPTTGPVKINLMAV
jgi:hypothetical protein